MRDTGVIHGRFQVLHNDHLAYLMAGMQRCRHLFIGITNPDPTLTRADPSDPHRSTPGANPLTYIERYIMIRTAMTADAGVGCCDFSIVPFPVNFPDLIGLYVPLDATFFLTIYDDWGRRKLKQFRDLGVSTEILWERCLQEKGLSASDVRLRMARHGSTLCPPARVPS
jgi:hypothetical protein